MKTIHAAIIAATALIVLPTVSEAQTATHQIEEQGRLVQQNLNAPEVVPWTPPPYPHDKRFPEVQSEPTSRLALEYRLATHVEAVARKYGQLDKVVKGCDYPEYWNFEESALVDLIGDDLTESTVGTARRSYAEGQKLKAPPCDQAPNFVGVLIEQVERHRKIILETSEKLRALKSGVQKNPAATPEFPD